MRVLDLFSGIGGFSLGLERAGMKTVAFCEIDPYCRAVLRKHWPDVPCYEDVHDVDSTRLAADGIGDIGVVCGGFPCQDISLAGTGAGLAGTRSGLWWQLHRIIADVAPRYAIIENVSALRSRGLDEVLRSLTAIGYDAQWHCIPASAVGAPHRRDRIWIIAYRNSDRDREPAMPEHAEASGLRCDVADSGRIGGATWREAGYMAGAQRAREADGEQRQRHGDAADDCCADVADTYRARLEVGLERTSGELTSVERGGWWATEPDVGRVAHGVPSRVDRLRALGNSVVPQIPEMIGRAILEAAHA